MKKESIALMMGACQEQWYPANKDTGSTGVYFAFPREVRLGEKYYGDYALCFDSDARWQHEAITWVEAAGYEWSSSSAKGNYRFSIHHWGSMTPSYTADAPSVLEATFEALYKLSQHVNR